MLRRLLDGELTVESNTVLQMVYGLHIKTTPDEWKRRLPNMFVCKSSAPHPHFPFAACAATMLPRSGSHMLSLWRRV